jgi:hypothetical protein
MSSVMVIMDINASRLINEYSIPKKLLLVSSSVDTLEGIRGLDLENICIHQHVLSVYNIFINQYPNTPIPQFYVS